MDISQRKTNPKSEIYNKSENSNIKIKEPQIKSSNQDELASTNNQNMGDGSIYRENDFFDHSQMNVEHEIDKQLDLDFNESQIIKDKHNQHQNIFF